MANQDIAALYEVHGPAILGYLKRTLGDVDAAEDVLQDTFAEALRQKERVLGASSARAWLFGVARRIALNAARRRKLLAPLPHQLPGKSASENPELERIRSLITRLPFELQETLGLRLQEELSYEEVAAVLAIPVGTVRSRLYRAVRELRRMTHIEKQ